MNGTLSYRWETSNDGEIWTYSPQSSSQHQLVKNRGAFAALKDDGSVVTWGEGAAGGYGSSGYKKYNDYENQDLINGLSSGVIEIFSTDSAFAALKDDGSVISWGGNYEPSGDYQRSFNGGGDSSAVQEKLTSGVKTIFSTSAAFALSLIHI